MYKIVIADDDEILLRGLSDKFSWSELDIELVAGVDNGQKALEAVKKHQADILLTDIRMPVMNGLELIGHVKAYDPDVAIIIISAYDEFSYAHEAIKRGADNYLLKPISLEALAEAIEQVTCTLDKKREMEDKISRLDDLQSLGGEESYLNYLEYDSERGETKAQFNHSNENKNRFMDVTSEIIQAAVMGNSEALSKDLNIYEQVIRQEGERAKMIFSHSASIIFMSLEKECGLMGISYQQTLGDTVENINRLMVKDTLREGVKELHKVLLQLSDYVAVQDDASTKQLMMKAVLYIEEHFKVPELRINEVAEHVGLSKNYFSNVFKATIGKSFTDYLIELRMEKAKQLLINTEYRGYEVSYMVGYNNPTYFSSTFKKFYGLSPSVYKKEHSR